MESGDVLVLRSALVLLRLATPRGRAARRLPAPLPLRFEADALGVVGESGPAWAPARSARVRRPGRRARARAGESGPGKELCARAVHALSAARGGRFVARNAATIPEGLVDAELFGNAKSYPNPGMPERAGLIGEADGGTLFLDEIGELPRAPGAPAPRARRRGRVPPARRGGARRADLRLVAATNRAPAR